ncbi:hypothetical protein SASPL_119501 [Salvia splendens]|uniref:Sigma 54 modulation/S30EA ribosomal protein C-terminal domain-containing protein n=1 Tax=Salvia splendens TaxID=180675 RepID=A0A8X8ZT70_SALSN|nr:hypothetical protein SASPL_119501 [Salvia splendens]
MALLVAPAIQKSFTYQIQHHVSCSTSSSSSSFGCSHSLSFPSQKSSFLGSGFRGRELVVQRSFGMKMSWDCPLSSVKLILQGKNLELNPSVKSYVEEKLGKAVQKHSHLVREVDVRLSIRGGEVGKGPKVRRCEVTLFTKKHGVIKEKDSDHGRHMKGFDRLKVRDHGALLVAEDIEAVPDEADEADAEGIQGEGVEEEEIIVRTKYFDMPPVTVSEAVEQLKNLDHDFYGFRNEETGEINIVYKRRAGGYGLITPKQNGETEKLEPVVVESTAS